MTDHTNHPNDEILHGDFILRDGTPSDVYIICHEPLTDEELAKRHERRERLRQVATRFHAVPPDDRMTKAEFLWRYKAKP